MCPLPLRLPAQGRPCDDELLVVERKLRRAGLRDLCSVTGSHVGFLFQFER